MKNLKENIKKNNMKKLVLSAVLGMFCYCTNNAMNEGAEGPKPTLGIISISDALTVMLTKQVKINEAKEEIKAYEKEIYCQITENGKVTKKKVLKFIKKQYTTVEQEGKKDQQENKDIQGNIEILEQYFHLKEIENESDECSEKNLTEIFWEIVEVKPENDDEDIQEDGVKKIKAYFKTIIDAEKAISEEFKKYYDTKMQIKGKEQKEGQVLEEIVKECYEGGEVNDITENLSAKLEKLCETESIEKNVAKEIIATIIKRITPDGQITEEKLKAFIKQKIEEKKKEVVHPSGGPFPGTKKECPCCC